MTLKIRAKDKIIIHYIKSTSPARFCYAITHLEIQWLKMIATTVLCLTVMMEVDQTQLGKNYLAPVCCCIPVLMECRRNALSKPSFFSLGRPQLSVLSFTPVLFLSLSHRIHSFQEGIFWNLDKSTLFENLCHMTSFSLELQSCLNSRED